MVVRVRKRCTVALNADVDRLTSSRWSTLGCLQRADATLGQEVFHPYAITMRIRTSTMPYCYV